jgi:putative hydrolase of the HAD superfamily
MPYKAILLDLDNTLFGYESAHKPALAASFDWLSAKLGVSIDTVSGAYTTARSQINQELRGHGASHSRLLYFQRLNEILGFNPCLTVLEAEEVYWSTFLDSMELRPGVLEFFEATKAIPKAIVTDLTAQIQFRKLARLKIEGELAAIATSEEAGAEKPAPRIFQLAVDKLGAAKNDCCMIGDNWERDIVGGTGFGIKSYWLKEESDGNEQESLSAGHDLIVEFGSFYELVGLL